MAGFATLTSRSVVLRQTNIDTDQIIPARFLSTTERKGLGKHAFNDWRWQADGAPDPAFPFNQPGNAGRSILLAGRNFGCGSSREHAPQAIYRYGIRAIIAEGFAEIFFGNSTTLGMPCVTVSHADRLALSGMIEADPSAQIEIDLEKKEIRAGGKTFACDIREANRQGLVTGHWDPIADLMDGAAAVDETAARLPYMAA